MNPVPSCSRPNLESFSAPFFFYSNNENAEITYISPSVFDVLGFRSEDLIGKKYTDFLDAGHPLNADVELHKCDRFKHSNARASSLRVVIDAKQGQKVLRVQTYGQTDSTGKVILNHGICEDITESFHFESKLRLRMHDLQSVSDELSNREKQVLERVMNGRLNKSIAKELEVTQRTIESTRSRLVKKFGVRTTAELVGMATEFQMLANMIQTVHGPNCLSHAFDALGSPTQKLVSN